MLTRIFTSEPAAAQILKLKTQETKSDFFLQQTWKLFLTACNIFQKNNMRMYSNCIVEAIRAVEKEQSSPGNGSTIIEMGKMNPTLGISVYESNSNIRDFLSKIFLVF
jgi:hypothetical protein